MRRLTLALVASLVAGVLAVAPAAGTPEQAPRRGGTLVIATLMQGEPPCLNPLVEACGMPGVLDRGLHEVLAGAFEVKPDATFRPDLISRPEVVSRRPVTLRYRIRPEARWSDGVPVTASDFVFTHQAIVEHRPEWLEFETLDNVRSVRALDAKTFQVVLRGPFPDWRYFFAAVLPRHALAGEELEKVWNDAIDNPKTGRPIGSGPFLVGSWERGRQLTLVRNPRYWGAHVAYLNRIVIRFLPADDAAEALRRGEVDMINPSSRIMQPEALELLRQKAPGISVPRFASTGLEHFDIRVGAGGHTALDNRLVRQALAYGVDRIAIARRIGQLSLDSAAALEPLDSFTYLANSPHYRPNWKGYRYRPDRARQLLEQAGCRLGSDGIYTCAGSRLSLRFVTIAGIESRERTLELVQAQLRRVGVEVRPVYALFDTLFGRILPSGDFDLALYAYDIGASTTGPEEIFECQQPANTTGYCDRLVSRDLDQATRILADGRRVVLLNRLDARLANAVPAIPLYQTKGLFALGASVRGVVPNGVGRFTWNSEDWWLADSR